MVEKGIFLFPVLFPGKSIQPFSRKGITTLFQKRVSFSRKSLVDFLPGKRIATFSGKKFLFPGKEREKQKYFFKPLSLKIH